MCGISGIINFNEKPVGKDQINLMNNSQIHRGPDGSGIWCDKNIGFYIGVESSTIFQIEFLRHLRMPSR